MGRLLTSCLALMIMPSLTSLQTLMSIDPTMEFSNDPESGNPPVFDFKFNIEMKEGAGIPPFPDCLPERVGDLPDFNSL